MTLLFYHIDRVNVSANSQILDLTLTLMWYWCVIIELKVDFQGLFQVQMFSVWINAAWSLISLISPNHTYRQNKGTLPSGLPPLRPTSHASPDYLFWPSRLPLPCLPPPSSFLSSPVSSVTSDSVSAALIGRPTSTTATNQKKNGVSVFAGVRDCEQKKKKKKKERPFATWCVCVSTLAAAINVAKQSGKTEEPLLNEW